MKKYEELKKAVRDGKFRKHKVVAGFARNFIDSEHDEVKALTGELFATVRCDDVIVICDDVIDEDTKQLVIESAMEALAEKLVEDKVFDYSKKLESFDDLLGFLKDAINL